VILPGLDFAMEPEAWDAIEPGHPQASLSHLLARMGAARGDVTEWRDADAIAPESRARALNLALRPADFLPDWRAAPPAPLGDIKLLEPSDQQEEAMAIAIALREGLQHPGHRVALITPDRGLATRVAAELARFGVVADDSAGEPLSATPPGLFLRLLIEAVQTGLAPVALLAFAKHPLAAFRMKPAAARDAARRLEKAHLRGPAPAPGIRGLRLHLAPRDAVADHLIDRLEAVLSPLIALFTQPAIEPAAFLELLIRTGEQSAATDEIPGPNRLWALEEGNALAEALAELRPAFAQLPPQDPGALAGLFAAALEGNSVRSRRALRGRATGVEHPRVFIWGLLEARLQSVDLAVLGGLTETIWPPAPDPGPWMNRKMRKTAGLPSPEEQIEQAAHDFVMASCCAPKIIYSVPKRRDGAPAVPARWITRLVALLRGWDQTIPSHPGLDWARQLDRAQSLTQRAKPAPRPPVSARPRALSVTDVELWFNDPYGLYAKRILKLKPLDPLEQNADYADFGNLVHAALASFFESAGADWPQDAAQGLEKTLCDELDRAALRPSIAAWWRPRLARIAAFIDHAETSRRATTAITSRHFEIKGILRLPGDFELNGRADRIERIAEDGFAIIDYKTGTVPTGDKVEAGVAPQLPLEAMMLEWGGFGPALQGEVHELAFWKLSGGREAGKVCPLWKKDQRAKTEEASSEARALLIRMIERFQDPSEPYRSAPDPRRMPRFSDYARLARRTEWAAAEDEEVTE